MLVVPRVHVDNANLCVWELWHLRVGVRQKLLCKPNRVGVLLAINKPSRELECHLDSPLLDAVAGVVWPKQQKKRR